MDDRIEPNKALSAAQQESLNKKLVAAATALDHLEAKSLINQRADVNYSDGETHVLWAALKKTIDSVAKKKPDLSFDPEVCGKEYTKYLILQTLIKSQVNINAPIDKEGNPALYKVLTLGKYGAAKFLIQNNADVNVRAQNNESVLYKVIKQHLYGAGEWLLENEAEPLTDEELASFEQKQRGVYQKILDRVNKEKFPSVSQELEERVEESSGKYRIYSPPISNITQQAGEGEELVGVDFDETDMNE
jgi:hypothetical protein